MAAILSPSNQLGFNRPLTRTITKTLTVTNPHANPIAFKVKTTAPKLYCVRPNSGRIEAGQSIDVAVILQAMRDEPPLSTKCKDKFLVQTTLITGARETKALGDLWTANDEDESTKIHQQKIKVAYLPPEGQAIPEDSFEHPSLVTSEGDLSRFDTVREHPPTNGHATAREALNGGLSVTPPVDRPGSPGEYLIAQEETTTTTAILPEPEPVPPIAPVVRAPTPAPIVEPVPTPVAPAPTTTAPTSMPEADDLAPRYAQALAEIERLQNLLNSQPIGVRRRTTRVVSEDGESVPGGSDDGTAVDSLIAPQQPEGVPVQVVAAIAFAVFLATYLFF